MTEWRLYIIDRNSHYYVGITTDLANRLRQHGHPALLYASPPMTRTEAVTLEKTIKKWTTAKSSRLVWQPGCIRAS